MKITFAILTLSLSLIAAKPVKKQGSLRIEGKIKRPEILYRYPSSILSRGIFVKKK